jgi:hypothetical protein
MPVTAAVPHEDELLGYAEKIHPLVGERAQRALALVVSGRVQRLAPTEDGHDCWEVKGSQDVYRTSIRARYCSCPDAANGAPRWLDGPLCKHRIAVMYVVRWEEETGKRLSAAPPIEESESRSEYAPSAEYLTIVPPQTPKQGWRWCHVRGFGRLSLYSSQEYATEEAVLQVALSVAQCKALPFHYTSSSSRTYPHHAIAPALYM